MSYFFKNTKKLTLILSAMLLVITLAAGSFAYAANGLPVGDEAGEVSSAPEQPDSEQVPDDAEEVDEVDEVDEDYQSGDSLGLTQLSAQPQVFNRPAEMRGAYLVPGSDFIKKYSQTADAIRADIDKAIQSAVSLEMNSVIIDTVYNDKVIFNTPGAPALYESFDAMEYITGKCREAGLYVYAIFDASLIDGDADKLSQTAYDFALEYRPDGVLIDGYETKSGGSFTDYAADGGSIGFDNYVRQTAALTVSSVARAVRRADPSIQAGLLAGAVWANESDNPLGSATKAKHTAYYSGNADTRSYVLDKMVDFVAVTAYGSGSDAEAPFGAVAGWWAQIAADGEIPLYIVHAASKAGSQEAGWSSNGELAKQVADARELSGCYGSIFNSLSRMASGSAAVSLTSLSKDNSKTETQSAVKELAATKTDKPAAAPAAANTTATAPKAAETSTGGSQLIKEISPTGVIMAEGDMSITISAVAVEGAEVYAKINGDTVPMEMDDDAHIDDDDSDFTLYTGEYYAPESDDEVMILGGVTVYASYNGKKQTMEGAHLAVASMEDARPVQITADQARTYPGNTKDNVPVPTLYPLPKGAQDYAVGKEVKFTKKSTKETFYYSVLASGVRVETKDLKEISSGPEDNEITGLEVEDGDDDYTYVTIETDQKVTYSVNYKGDTFSVTFNNTTGTPSKTTLTENKMFSKAKWSNDNTLTLTLNKANCFMGFKGYYDKNGNLVFQFNNPPSSIKTAKIAVDAGHGGKDVGTLGYSKDYPESVIAASIAKKLVAELEDRGAEVMLIDNSGVKSIDRPQQAEEFGADILVSIHCNSAVNKKATGTEAFYFYSFSKPLATSAAANVSAQLDTDNRGPKPSYYNVTLSPQMSSVLIETGFLSNKAEYEKLIKSSYQKKIAVGAADSIVAAIKSAKTGAAVTGVTTKVSDDYDEDEDDSDDDSASENSGAVGLSQTSLRLAEGEKATLEADADVTWKSSDTTVATVTSKGVVTARSGGTAKITATDKETGETATCNVTVKAEGTPGVKIDKLYITSGEEKLTIGKSVQLEIDYDPSDAYDSSVTWSSSDKSVATVSSDGLVKAVKAGTAVITATSADGGKVKSTTCDIIVSAEAVAIPDTGVALSKAGSDLYLDYEYMRIYPGNTSRVTVMNANGDIVRGSDFKWKSSDTKIATVDSAGIVTAKTVGDATITATYGKNTLECDIEVSRTKIAIKGIKLEKTSTVIVRGKSERIIATLSPYDATDRDITWTSSNSRIASVDSNGTVTGVNAGKVTITAKTKTGGYTAKCEVEVVRSDIPIEDITLYFDTLEMSPGEEVEMTYTLSPDNATETGIVWTSSNTKVATVDSKGMVTAVAKGKTTIKATAANDKKIYYECTITVYD